jgi:lipoprotein-anchoring transpeptidase ErfK/SrfK
MKKGFFHRIGQHKKLLIGLFTCLLVLTGCFTLGYKGAGAFSEETKGRVVTSVGKTGLPDDPAKTAASENQQAGEALKATEKLAAPVPLTPGKTYKILVDKSEHMLYLYDGDTVVRKWTCAVGRGGLGQKQRRGDNMTPVGTFRIDEIDDASSWTHDFGDGKGAIAGAYGPWFLSLDTNELSGGAWDGIGIHGTHDPASLGTDASEGCIRLDNRNLEELHRIARVGMLVEIRD